MDTVMIRMDDVRFLGVGIRLLDGIIVRVLWRGGGELLMSCDSYGCCFLGFGKEWIWLLSDNKFYDLESNRFMRGFFFGFMGLHANEPNTSPKKMVNIVSLDKKQKAH